MYIFKTSIKLLSRIVGKALVVRPLEESIRENLPEIILKSGYRKCRVILDCIDVFTEMPKSLTSQAAACLYRKHQDTFTFWLRLH